MSNTQAAAIAPDVGTLFEYGLDGFGRDPAKYRVTGWMRQRPWRASPYDMVMAGALVNEAGGRKAVFAAEILGEILSEEPAAPKRMEFCLQEFATHVSGSGVCGCVAPISEIRVTGVVEWPADLLANERVHAVLLGSKCEVLV